MLTKFQNDVVITLASNPFLAMSFKHLVGKSTPKEGITIHENFESFFESPDLGEKKDITLLYGNNQCHLKGNVGQHYIT